MGFFSNFLTPFFKRELFFRDVASCLEFVEDVPQTENIL